MLHGPKKVHPFFHYPSIHITVPSLLRNYFQTCKKLILFLSWQLWECNSQGCENAKTRLDTPPALASIPAHRWHCCNVWFRGSIEQKSPSEQCSHRAVMKDRLSMEPCLALALWSHWHIPQVLITKYTPRRSCGRSNMEDAWHLDTCCKIYWDNWDTTEREVHQVCFSW